MFPAMRFLGAVFLQIYGILAHEPTVHVENSAYNAVRMMNDCVSVIELAPGSSQTVTVPKQGATYYFVPEGVLHDCRYECSSCFYFAASVQQNGALVGGIGYGGDNVVNIHDGVGKLFMSGTRENTNEYNEVLCTTEKCSRHDFIAGFNMHVEIGADGPAPTPTPKPQPPTYDPILLVRNDAGNSVNVMAGCKVVVEMSANSAHHVTVPRLGGTKYWIAPKGLSYNCKLDCLECFYIAANVAPSGALVVGIGYGDNSPAKFHDGVGGIVLSAKWESTKLADFVVCAPGDCNFNHIIAGFNATVVINGEMATDESILV
jgi:hypothetical protein